MHRRFFYLTKIVATIFSIVLIVASLSHKAYADEVVVSESTSVVSAQVQTQVEQAPVAEIVTIQTDTSTVSETVPVTEPTSIKLDVVTVSEAQGDLTPIEVKVDNGIEIKPNDTGPIESETSSDQQISESVNLTGSTSIESPEVMKVASTSDTVVEDFDLVNNEISSSGGSVIASSTLDLIINSATSTEKITASSTNLVSTSTIDDQTVTTTKEVLVATSTYSNIVQTSTSISTSTIQETFFDTSTTTVETISVSDLLPNIVEQDIDNGKLITVSSPDGHDDIASPMTDVLVRIAVQEVFRVGQEDKIKIKWKNNENQEMQFVAFDDDENGYIDHVKWVVPHLSTQTFEIIYVSRALRLDSNKDVIEDIFDLVKSKDKNYVNLISGQYTRITFESLLDNTRDITLYAKPCNFSESSKVEVYTTDGQLITTFANIDHDGKYRIILTNLENPADVFDLKIIGNVDIDYIIDPPVTAYWVGGSGNWSDAANHWSDSPGGAAGVDNLPDATSNVIFDTSSGATAVTATIDQAFTIASLTISGFTGTITQNANLTVVGDYAQNSAATFNASDPNNKILGVNGSFAVTAGTFKRYTGMGIGSDPFMVYDVFGLQGIRTGLSNSYQLFGDINAATTTGWNANTGFIPIGTLATPFNGIFDGNSHVISDLFINATSTITYIGLFGYSTNQISNVTLFNASINATSTAGTNGSSSIDGANGGTVTANANASTSPTAGTASATMYVGGLVGYNTGIISNAGISGTVYGNGGQGGTGGNGGNGGTIAAGSANTAGYGAASVSNAVAVGGTVYVGGLIGWSQQGSINNSSSTATVRAVGGTGGTSGNGGEGGRNLGTGIGGAGGSVGVPGAGGSSYAGGLVGLVTTGVISNSFSTGNVTARGGIGGTAGFAGNGGAGSLGGGTAIGGIGGNGAAGGAGGFAYVGGLVGSNAGDIENGSYSSGIVQSFGGLAAVGSAGGNASTSPGNNTASGGLGGLGGAGGVAYAGGLVGLNTVSGVINGSSTPVYSTSAVTSVGAAGGNAGTGGNGGNGQTGGGPGALGATIAGGTGGTAYVGGLVGNNLGLITSAYSTTGLITLTGGVGGIGGTGGMGGTTVSGTAGAGGTSGAGGAGNNATVVSSYAGGLAGSNSGTI